jgi:hypothetical protein
MTKTGTQPIYGRPDREAMDERSDRAPEVPANPPRAAQGNSPEGEHHAAGGRVEHRRPDGGLGMGHKAPPGWPRYHEEG